METMITKENSMADILVTSDGKRSRAIMLHRPLCEEMKDKWKELRCGPSVTGAHVSVYMKIKPEVKNDSD